MGAEDGLALVGGVVERLDVVPVPLFPSGGTNSHVRLHLLHIVHSGLDHSRLVHIVLGQTPALEGALSSLPGPPRAIALSLLRLGLVLGNDIINIYIIIL